MAFSKGRSGNPAGRPKGVPNKNTTDIKDAIVGALNADGGAEKYMRELKRERPEVFAGLVKAILPKDVNLTAEVSGVVSIVRSFVSKPEEK